MATSRICSIPECGKPHFGKGFCKNHLSWWNRHTNPVRCSVDGCENPADRRGYCTSHYMRQRRNNGNPTAGRTPSGARLAFLCEAVAATTDDCIIWPFPIHSVTGYGSAKIDGVSMTAHRAALYLATGESPSRDIHAAHAPEICHNRACVNPRHLRWATREENEADKAIDGTKPLGPDHPNAKLTADQVRSIRKDCRSDAKIGKELGVSEHAVRCVRIGKTYQNVA